MWLQQHHYQQQHQCGAKLHLQRCGKTPGKKSHKPDLAAASCDAASQKCSAADVETAWTGGRVWPTG